MRGSTTDERESKGEGEDEGEGEGEGEGEWSWSPHTHKSRRHVINDKIVNTRTTRDEHNDNTRVDDDECIMAVKRDAIY
jgi:hypothetical protein